MQGTRTVSLYGGKVNITFTSDGHGYLVHEKGKNAPGVTEIIKAATPKSWEGPWMKKVALGYFREQVIKGRTDYDVIVEEAKREDRRISSSGADRGKLVHQWIERWVTGPKDIIEFPLDAQVTKACTGFLGWVKEHQVRVLESERIVYSEKMAYCGTLDMLALVDGETAIVDIKARKTPEYFREDGLQMGAYALALGEETGEQINHGWLLALDKNTGIARPHYVPIRRQLKDDFCRCVDWYRSLQRLDWMTDEIKEATAAGKRAGLGTMTQALRESGYW